MAKLNDVQNAAIRSLVGNRCFSKAVLAINAGSALTVKTTVVPSGGIVFSSGGIQKLKADLSAVALAVSAAQQQKISGQQTFYTQPANTTAYIVVALDSGGTPYAIQGTYAGQVKQSSPIDNLGTGDIPDVGDSLTPIGYIKVVTGATTFLPATDALDKASVTFTFADLSCVPATNP
jgi:hypothetical protein